MGSSEKLAECDVGLGLKMQQQRTIISKKKMMTMPSYHHHHHESRMISSPSESGSGGPIFCSGSNQVVACMSDIYDVVGSGSGSGVPTSLQHFNNTATDSTFKSSSSSSSSSSPSSSESGRVVTFTPLQWEELERQTMIYKYIMASIPIPSQLLLAPPTTTTIKDAAPPLKSNRTWGDRLVNTNTTNGSDREPWRCRRTDGKKWRCSRDVAPDQKYCERHAHKNKPRSRKPVELLQQQQSLSKHPNYQHQQQKSSQFLNQTDHHLPPYPTVLSSSPFEPRYSDWFMKGGGTASVSTSNNQQQQWQQLMQPTIGLKRDSSNCYKNLYVYQQQQPVSGEESLNAQNDQCSLLLGPKLVSTSNLEGALNLDSHTERPRDFISAWSRENNVNGISSSSGNRCCSVSSNGKLPLSSLSLSMAGDSGTTTNREDEQVEDASAQMGGVRSHSLFNWMSPGSWMGSTPGGPLAEALCLGMANNSKLVSPAASPPNGNGGCHSGTTNSSSHWKSPSGDNSSSHGFNLI